MNKLALVASVVLLVVGGLWLVVRGGSGGRGARTAPSDVPGEVAAESVPAELAPSTGSAPAERTKFAAREAPPTEALPVEHQSFDLADARWLDVGVVIPSGLPLEDTPALIGFTSKEEIEDGVLHGLEYSDFLGADDSFARELGEGDHWSRRPLAARVRLPFPPGASSGLLMLQSRYLHLDPLEVELTTTSSVTLEPELGGWVSGRCLFPAAAPAPGEISIEFSGRERSEGLMGFARQDSRDARVRADLGFELRALSAQRKYAIQAQAPGFVGHFELSFQIAPGEHRVVELAFRAGATVSGTVRGDGQPLAGADVRAAVKGTLPWNNDIEAESGPDGAFRLAGLPTGKVMLHASKGGWLDAESATLDVIEGQELSGIELALGAGQRIHGRVLWPGGAPVADAEVKALKARERWMETLVEAKCGADGTFVLGGLADEAVEVFAEHGPSEPRDEETLTAGKESAKDPSSSSASVHSGRWIAVAPAVTPGSSDLTLTLQPPNRVSGRVADDTGQPVRSFRINARRVDRPGNAPEGVEHNFDAEDAASSSTSGCRASGPSGPVLRRASPRAKM